MLASKVYYHLGELDEALTFALGAGTKFDVTAHNLYVHTIIGTTTHVRGVTQPNIALHNIG